MAALVNALPRRRNSRTEKFLRAFHRHHFHFLFTTGTPGNDRMSAHRHKPVRFRFQYGSFTYSHLIASTIT